ESRFPLQSFSFFLQFNILFSFDVQNPLNAFCFLHRVRNPYCALIDVLGCALIVDIVDKSFY
ncbi:hypothetical protein, partial [Pectobacterium brasiliense]|uniref:hypothetical protein n=1 Tax=Pectobacterium brasiliense TaxID=180957 RepID=UPI001C5CCFE2